MKKARCNSFWDKTVDIGGILIVSFFLLQILPSIITSHTGIDSVMAAIMCSVLTAVISICGYSKMTDAAKECVPVRRIKPAMWILLAFVIIVYARIDANIFLWISNHIQDVGMEMREEYVMNVNIYVYLIYGIIFAPISEECLFRIFFYHQLKCDFSWETAMFISAIVFGLMHMTISHAIGATLLGIIFVLIMEYTQNIYITIFCHMFYNLCITFLPSGTGTDMADSTAVMAFMMICLFILIGILIAKRDDHVRSLGGKI